MSLFDRIADSFGDFLDEVMLPEEIRFLHERARSAIRRGDYQAALQLLGEAEHRRPGVERTRHLRALCRFYLGDLPVAIELFEEAISLREEASSHFYLGLCHEQLLHFPDAHLHFQRALELDPDPPFLYDLHFGMGRALLAMNRPGKAARELRKALRVWPDQRDAAVLLAEALRQRGRIQEARDVLDQALLGGPADPDALLTRGRIEAADHNHRAAAAAFDAVLDARPDDLEALLAAARSLLAIGQPAPANRHLLRALGSLDDDQKASAEVYALLGETNERIQNLQKAFDSYSAALLRDPSNSQARLGAARTALELQNIEEASQHFEALLNDPANPARPLALLGLGRCRLALNDPAGARHLLDEADQVTRDPSPELLRALGQVSLASDDPAEALVALQTALHSLPEDHPMVPDLHDDIHSALQALRPDFRLPDHFPSTADLVATLSQLRDLLANSPRLESFLPRVHDLFHTLETPLSVAVLGEFNAGKSTLINAILQEDVVPTGVLPTTAHPLIMGYGPRKGARVVYEDQRLQDVDFATAQQLMRDDAQSILRLHYTYPHPELRSINFWDTPGFNALDERHECLAAEALEQAEAILWMLDANQALKDSEFDRLQSIPDAHLRVLLVVNKIDRFGDPDQRQPHVEEILEYLHDNAGDDVLAILAISALEARQDPDAPDFQRLLALLDKELVQRSWLIKIAEISRSLNDLLAEIEDTRQRELLRFRELQDTATSLGSLIDTASADPEGRAASSALQLSDRLDFVTLGVDREITESMRRRGRLLRRVVLDPDDRSFVVDLFRERLLHVLQRSQHEILQDINHFEHQVAEATGPLITRLDLSDARALRRRIDGYYDENRALKTLLDERVFGQWRARADGQITAGAESTLDAIIDLGPDAQPDQRRALLHSLIPPIDREFSQRLQDWYREFFLAARRFSDRLHRDLTTLELEVEHRMDFTS